MHALRVLEFGGVTERLQTFCETALGGELALELLPSFEADEVWHRLEQTREAMDFMAKNGSPPLARVRDLRQALDLAKKGGVLGGAEIFQIADALSVIRNLKTLLTPKRHEYPKLWAYAEFLPEHKRLEDAIFDSLESDGTVKDGASPALQTLRQRKKSAASRVQERIQSYTTGSSRDLLSDPIYTVRDGRYVIPVKSENRGKIRGIVHDTSATGATVFLEPEDVLQLGNAVREIEAAERAEVVRILTSLSGKVGAVAGEAIHGIENASTIDFLLAKAKLGYDMRGTIAQPLAGEGSVGIKIQGGRHPLLDPATVVPLDIEIYPGRSVLITGPNTGGKTVAIKTVGLFVLMSQSGIPLPALDVRLGPFSQVWADIGDEQSLQQSLSTFSGHIKNIGEALKGLKKGSVVLLDEVGAGTDPAEGAALARAILMEMHQKGAAILASTHYGELKAFAFNTPGFQNAAMEFDAKSLRPTYRLLMGAPGASHALRIAERYGISKEVVEQARQGLTEQQQDVALMLEKLDQAQRQARVAQGEADRRLNELKKKDDAASKKLAEAEKIRENVHGKAQELIETALREIRLEAARLFDELKQAKGNTRDQEALRSQLKELQDVGAEFAHEFKPKRVAAARTEKLVKGMTVKIEGYSQAGTLLEEPKNGNAVVQMGVLKMTVPESSVRPVREAVEPKKRATANLRLNKSMHASTEIHLRHMRAEDATNELERFIDDAVLAGLPSVRIVHGKGEGVLRKVTQDYLRRHPHVSSYRSGDAGEGGDGVTIASFK